MTLVLSEAGLKQRARTLSRTTIHNGKGRHTLIPQNFGMRTCRGRCRGERYEELRCRTEVLCQWMLQETPQRISRQGGHRHALTCPITTGLQEVQRRIVHAFVAGRHL